MSSYTFPSCHIYRHFLESILPNFQMTRDTQDNRKLGDISLTERLSSVKDYTRLYMLHTEIQYHSIVISNRFGYEPHLL